jgi:hypothetical protein
VNQNAESCPEELVLLEIRDLRRRGVRGELRPSDGTPGLFFISAIQGRTFEIFLEEYKEHESWIDGVKDLFLDYDDYPILLREDGRTIASATKPSSFMETFDVVFDQTGYILQRRRGYRKNSSSRTAAR